MWSKITDYISFFFKMLKKHGIFGRKEQVKFIFRKYIDAEWVWKDVDQTEAKQLYRKICKQYSEIRLHVIYTSHRIGEYISRYLMAVEDSKNNAEKGILDVFFLGDYIHHNSRLTTIMGRNIHIIDEKNTDTWGYVLTHFHKVKFYRYLSDYRFRNIKRSLNPQNTAQYFLFTPEEEEEAKRKKELMGLHGTYVCVSSRDAAYLATTHPDVDNSYNDFRDSDINNLVLAVDYLADKQIMTVRMGRHVKDKVSFGNCIDYANKYYDELMDIALMKKCKFYIGDENGLCLIPEALNVPCAFKNVIPVFIDGWRAVPQNPLDLYIFKKYYSKGDNRFLSIREMTEIDQIVMSGGHILSRETSKKYAELGIEIIDNSAEEIRDLAMEMNARIDGQWIETEEDKELQNEYRNIFNQWAERWHYDEYAVKHANIGALFLRKNSFLLD